MVFLLNSSEARVRDQNMPHWHRHLELEANENQYMQKEAFPECPLSDEKQKLLRNEECYQSLLEWFYGHKEDKAGAEVNMHKPTSIHQFLHILPSYNLLPWEISNPFVLTPVYKFIVLLLRCH